MEPTLGKTLERGCDIVLRVTCVNEAGFLLLLAAIHLFCALDKPLLYIGRRISWRSWTYLGSWRRFFNSGSTLMSGSPASRCS
jgi:hypothetical protein